MFIRQSGANWVVTMIDEASAQRPRFDPSMKIGYVSLNVSDLEKSLDFYQRVLGFKPIVNQDEGRAVLSADGNSRLVELVQTGLQGSAHRSAGLYHFAVLLPERKFLADMLLNLRDKKDEVYFDGMSDHLVSEAIYIRDPDFNGVEIYRDRPGSEWRWSGSKIRMATEPLDTADLLKEATESGWKTMPANTVIGHVHLHVRNLAKAMQFYRDLLGLEFTATYPNAYFFAAGGYHHHIATNTWIGTAIPPASPDKVGLNHFGIELPEHEVEKILGRMTLENENGFVHDPDGIRIRLYSS